MHLFMLHGAKSEQIPSPTIVEFNCTVLEMFNADCHSSELQSQCSSPLAGDCAAESVNHLRTSYHARHSSEVVFQHENKETTTHSRRD